MGIVSSVIREAGLQADGRRSVVEVHTDQLGIERLRCWLAPAGADLNAALAAYAVEMTADLAANELAAAVGQITSLGSLAVVVLNYATLAQVRTALRQAYQGATRDDAIMIGDFLSGLTSAQLQTLFIMTAGEVTTLRANKLTPAANLAASIRSAAGA